MDLRAERAKEKEFLQAKAERIGQTIREIRTGRRITLTLLQGVTGINTGTLSRIERGKQKLTKATLTVLSTAMGVELEDIVGDEEDTEDWLQSAPIFSRPVLRASDYATTNLIPEGSAIAVSRLKVERHGAGRKQQGKGYSFERSAAYTFLSDTIRDLSSSPLELGSYEVDDDAMYPRLYEGDHVVVDTEDVKIPAKGGIFAVIIDGQNIAIRRLFHMPRGGLIIACDNQSMPQIQLSAAEVGDIVVVGRVKAAQSTNGF